MRVSASIQPGGTDDAATVALGVFEDTQPPEQAPKELAQLLSSGEARTSFKALALAHAEGRRWLLVGLGPRGGFTHERARVAAAGVPGRARELSTRALCWLVPEGDDQTVAAALVEGTILSDYRFERFKSTPAEGEDGDVKSLDALIVSG